MKRPVWILTVLLAASGFGCAAGSLSTGEGFNVIRTKNAALYSNVNEQQYLSTKTSFEYARSSLASSFFKTVDLGEVDVLIIEGSDFDSIFGYDGRVGAAMSKSPGNVKIGANGLVVTKPDLNGDNLTQLLTYLYVDKMAPKAPLWFREGFAKWVRSSEYKEGEGGEKVACFGRIQGGKEPIVKIGDLIGTSWEGYNSENGKWFSYTSRTLIDFIVAGEGGKYQEQMGPMVAAIREGKESNDLFQQAFAGMSFDQLTTKLTEHGNTIEHQAGSSAGQARGLCPMAFPVPPEQAPDTSDPKVEPANAADVKALVDALRKLPSVDSGVAPWFPPEVVARVQ